MVSAARLGSGSEGKIGNHHCFILPRPENRVTLADEKDRFGLPVAHVSFNLHDNHKKLIKFAKEKTMEVMAAAGATEVVIAI